MQCLVVDQLLRELNKVCIFARIYTDGVTIICRVDDKEVLSSLTRFTQTLCNRGVRRLNSQ